MKWDSANKLLKKVMLSALLGFVGGVFKAVGAAFAPYILVLLINWLLK